MTINFEINWDSLIVDTATHTLRGWTINGYECLIFKGVDYWYVMTLQEADTQMRSRIKIVEIPDKVFLGARPLTNDEVRYVNKLFDTLTRISGNGEN